MEVIPSNNNIFKTLSKNVRIYLTEFLNYNESFELYYVHSLFRDKNNTKYSTYLFFRQLYEFGIGNFIVDKKDRDSYSNFKDIISSKFNSDQVENILKDYLNFKEGGRSLIFDVDEIRFPTLIKLKFANMINYKSFIISSEIYNLFGWRKTYKFEYLINFYFNFIVDYNWSTAGNALLFLFNKGITLFNNFHIKFNNEKLPKNFFPLFAEKIEKELVFKNVEFEINHFLPELVDLIVTIIKSNRGQLQNFLVKLKKFDEYFILLLITKLLDDKVRNKLEEIHLIIDIGDEYLQFEKLLLENFKQDLEKMNFKLLFKYQELLKTDFVFEVTLPDFILIDIKNTDGLEIVRNLKLIKSVKMNFCDLPPSEYIGVKELSKILLKLGEAGEARESGELTKFELVVGNDADWVDFIKLENFNNFNSVKVTKLCKANYTISNEQFSFETDKLTDDELMYLNKFFDKNMHNRNLSLHISELNISPPKSFFNMSSVLKLITKATVSLTGDFITLWKLLKSLPELECLEIIFQNNKITKKSLKGFLLATNSKLKHLKIQGKLNESFYSFLSKNIFSLKYLQKFALFDLSKEKFPLKEEVFSAFVLKFADLKFFYNFTFVKEHNLIEFTDNTLNDCLYFYYNEQKSK